MSSAACYQAPEVISRMDCLAQDGLARLASLTPQQGPSFCEVWGHEIPSDLGKLVIWALSFHLPWGGFLDLTSEGNLDGRNRAIIIAESLARVIAAIRIASVRWRSYLPQKHRK